MSGTLEGGKKACKTNLEKYGKDFYANIGRKDGKNGHSGGFASDKVGKDGLTGYERARVAGKKGGEISKRGKAISLSDAISKAELEELKDELRLLKAKLERALE